MSTKRIPVYLWKDNAGNTCALPIDAYHMFADESLFIVVAAKPEKALKQLREGIRAYVKARQKNEGSFDWPEETDYEIKTVPISIRPRYKTDSGDCPLQEPIEFHLPLIVGIKPHGSTVQCCLPTVMEWFSCFPGDDYRQTAVERYRDSLDDTTPEDILSTVAPLEGRIEEISVSMKVTPKKNVEKRFEHLERSARPFVSSIRRGGSAAYGREDVVQKLIPMLRDGERNIALLAPEGTGRSTILAAAVRSIERRRKGDAFETDSETETPVIKHRFWRSAAANMISGAKYLGQWQERVEKTINELSTFDGVLCVDSLVDFSNLGGGPDESVAAFLVPYLEAGKVRIVGEITPKELEVLRQRNADFIDKFQLFPIEPLTPAEAGDSLRQLAESLIQERKGRNKTEIATEIPSRVVRLFHRFYPYQPLPGPAAAFLRQLIDKGIRSGKSSLGTDDLLSAFLEETGLPENLLRDDEPLPFETVLDSFRERIIGQDAACEFAAQTVVQYKAAMNHPGRPIRSMLFCGPTGVGKTQLAKTLGEYLFGNDSGKTADGKRKGSKSGSRLFRVDMSEYMHPWSATRLIEQEDGSPSPLIKHVRRKPFGVVLFDEIEKAASEVFDLLLGLLDEGRLTDRLGRTTSFQSSIIIMTSNLGSGLKSIGFGDEHRAGKGDARFLKAVRDFFRPEFFNRIDDVVPFSALDRDSCRRIVLGELDRLTEREGLAQRNLKLIPNEKLVDDLVAHGFDPRYGARPLQRMIESTVLPRLARRLLDPSTANDDSDGFAVERF